MAPSGTRPVSWSLCAEKGSAGQRPDVLHMPEQIYELRSLNRRLLKSPFLYSRQQGGGLNAHKLGCAMRAFVPPMGFFENHQEVVTLAALHLGFAKKSWYGSVTGW